MLFRRCTTTIVLLVFVLTGMTTPALAEATTADIERARSLVAQGRSLCTQNDLEGALRAFQTADELIESATTGLEVAQVQAVMGRVVEARETLRRVFEPTRDVPDPFATPDAQAKAVQLDNELKARIATLRFEVSGLGPGANPSISIDERPSPGRAGAPRLVNPGRHRIVAKSDSRQASAIVDAGEGQSVTVTLAFDAPAGDVETEPRTADPHSGRLPPLAYIGLGVGAAGVAMTGISAILSATARKTAADRACANNCPPASWAEADRERRMLGKMSGVGLALGAAGLGLTIGSILARSKPKAPASGGSSAGDIARSLSITPAPGGVGLSVRF